MTEKPIFKEQEEKHKKSDNDLHAFTLSGEGLTQSETHLRDILSSIEDGYYEVNIAGDLTFFNDSLCKIYGYTRDELMGMGNREYMSPETAKKTYEIFNRVYRTGEPTKIYDWEFIKKDGSTIYVEISISLIKDSAGEAVGFRGIVRNITERKRIEAALKKTHNELEQRVEERTKELLKINKQLKREINERTQFEVALQESEEKYRLLVESTADWVWSCDIKGRQTFSNPAIKTILGCEVHEIVGLSYESLLHPEDHRKIRNWFKNAIENKTGWEKSVLRWQHKDGTIKFLESTAKPILDEKGNLTGFIGVDRDITERKQAEEILKEQTKTLNNILEKAADGICVCHNISEEPYVRFTHWNPRMTEITGYTIEEINRSGWYQSMYPDPELQQKAIERMATMRKGDDIQTEEWVITTKSGGEKSLSMSTSIIDDEDGKVHVLALMQDITERKKAEEALRASEEKYRFLAENMVDMVWTLDEDFRTTYVSPSIEKALGFTAEERQQQALEEMITPESLQNVQMKFLEELQREEDGVSDPNRSVTMEVEYYRKDLSIVWMENTMSAIRGPDGAFVGIHGVSRDITERKQSEEMLEYSKARLKALSEASFEAIFLSEKGVFLDQNQAAGRMFGYTRAEAVGMRGTEWTSPDDRERVKNNMRSGYEKPYEVTALRKDGTTFPCEIQARMIEYQGRPIRVTALRDITERKKAEEALRQAHDELEQRVKERTKALEIQKRSLEDVNTALNVMLKKREEDRLVIEERVLFNIKELIEPLLGNLKESGLDDSQTGYVDTLETFLAEIVSPFSQTLHTKYLNLTLSEIRVANLIKEGKTTKEIARLLNSTPRAVDFHRQNLRKKLGLSNRKVNLASHLLHLFK